VIAVALDRAPSPVLAFVPGAALGGLLLVVALLFGGAGLGAALFLGGATYVAAVAAAGQSVDGTAPLVAVLLLLCGELTAWSLDERLGIEAEPALARRRGAAVATLGAGGLVVATLVVGLSAVGPIHGLGWTVLGAAAALAAAGTGIWFAHR
jgi:vacuolar-type H+-ATPase subunit I/STV1